MRLSLFPGRGWCPAVLLLCLVALGCPTASTAQRQHNERIEVMVVGVPHLNQLYNQTPASDVYSSKKQAELAKLRAHLRRFKPEAIMVEAEPKEQLQLDSLYALYRNNQLDLAALPTGRSERYQIGFVLARQLNLATLPAIDYYAATAQSLLRSGQNINLFQQDLKELQTVSRPLGRLVQHDSLSVYDFIALANHPALVALSHRALFNTPALVMNGAFTPGGLNTNKLGPVDTTYIGAHYITLFYNRNLKIYSNILRAQQKSQARRVLVLLGQTHVGVQEELFGANPGYHVVPATRYLKTRKTKLIRRAN